MCRAGGFVRRDVAVVSECRGGIDRHLGPVVAAPSIGYLLLAVRLLECGLEPFDRPKDHVIGTVDCIIVVFEEGTTIMYEGELGSEVRTSRMP